MTAVELPDVFYAIFLARQRGVGTSPERKARTMAADSPRHAAAPPANILSIGRIILLLWT